MFNTTLVAKLFVLCLAGGGPYEPKTPQPLPANILVIVADDVGVDRVGAYGEHPDPGRTPRIDQLAAQGILFRNAWANPICSPTRSTILTGKYCLRTGVGHFVSQFQNNAGLDTGEHTTIAKRLQPAHQTAAVGKWHLADHSQPDYASHPNQSGFDYYAGSLYNLFGNQGDCDGDLIVDKQDYFRWIKTTQGSEVKCHSVYATTDTTNEAISFIDSAGQNPWFLYVAYNAAHTPFHRPPDNLHTYDAELDANPDIEGNEPLYMKAMTEAMDTEIGRLLDHLSPSVRNRTSILFVGDNGTTGLATTAPFDPDRAKGTVYEGGLNVPLIISSPQITAQNQGAQSDALVNTTDLFSTIGDLAGIDAVPHDSVSLVPYLLDPTLESIRDYVYAEIFQENGPGPYENYRRACRGKQYKFIRKWDEVGGIEIEFYDLLADPFENDNLVEGDQHDLLPDQLAEFHRLQKIVDCDLPDWDPAVYGEWEDPFHHYTTGADFDPPLDDDTDSDDGFNAVHMGLIPKGFHQGRVIVWDVMYGASVPPPGATWNQRWSILDVTQPISERFLNDTLKLPHDQGDLFCVGHTWTGEGNYFIAGGTVHYPDGPTAWLGGFLCLLFVPPPTADLSNAWILQDESLAHGRWYPTVTFWGRDKIFVFGGAEETGVPNDPSMNTYEVYSLDSSGLQATSLGEFNGPQTLTSNQRLHFYARMTVLDDGRIYRSGYSKDSARLTHDPDSGVAPSWQYTAQNDRRRIGGASVLLPNLPGFAGKDVVMTIGGRDRPEDPTYVSERSHYSYAAIGNADWNQNLPTMHHKRWRGNAVLLPDARILTVGGDRHAYVVAHIDEDPTFNPEIFTIESIDPGTGEITGHWQALPCHSGARTYHSTAILLPSGKVLIGGGDTREWDYQVYAPSYLMNGTERPVISQAPLIMNYSQTSQVTHKVMTSGAEVESVVLMRPCSATHHSDFDQRYYRLEITGQTASEIKVNTPTNLHRAPPGYYMLFLVSDEGTPSEASWVLLR